MHLTDQIFQKIISLIAEVNESNLFDNALFLVRLDKRAIKKHFPNVRYELLNDHSKIISFKSPMGQLTLDAVTSSGILKAKQKLSVTFNSDKLGGIDFTKFSKLSMCSAGAGRCWLVQWSGLPHRHCTWSVLKFL